MPIVTNGLLFYWNGKQGRVNQQLNNIAPGGPVLPITFTGATYDATNGYFTFDGVDDYAQLNTAGTAIATVGSFTFEYLYQPLNDFTDNDWHELLDGAMYFDHDDSVPGMYVTLFQGTTRVDVTINTAAVQTPRQMHIMWIFDAAASTVRYFVNGVKVHTRTGSTGLRAANGGTVDINRGLQHQEFNARFNAMRFYNRALTDAEAATNFANGLAVGLSDPQTKIAELRVKVPTGIVSVPIYAFTGAEAEPLRVKTADGVGYIPLVLVTDPAASSIRVQTHKGLRALKK